ncbi:MAG: serine/threonine protein kinase [Deltaproteobacteria bacterium]|nr:serine/threonine protein kinase [Deltaproteobacteria bacterium]
MNADEGIFGQYRLLRRIAFGGMAEIFLAVIDRDAGFKKRLVVKRILPQFSLDPNFVQMFIDEAVVIGRLSHPNITQIYDFGQVDSVYFMAMEYIDGADLRQILIDCEKRDRPLTFAETAAIGESIARGLAYAHSFADERLGPLHIVHRDISPHNIMISRAGDVKIMDFGIAKAAARATHTAAGTIKGKVAYMAPEQAAGEELDSRCDQFSLGVVLWEIIARQRLFQGNSDLDIIRRVIECDIKKLSSIRTDIPTELENIISRCLLAKPSERYASLSNVEKELSSFRYSLGVEGAVQLGSLVDIKNSETNKKQRQTMTLPADEDENDEQAVISQTLETPSNAIAAKANDFQPTAATAPTAIMTDSIVPTAVVNLDLTQNKITTPEANLVSPTPNLTNDDKVTNTISTDNASKSASRSIFNYIFLILLVATIITAVGVLLHNNQFFSQVRNKVKALKTILPTKESDIKNTTVKEIKLKESSPKSSVVFEQPKIPNMDIADSDTDKEPITTPFLTLEKESAATSVDPPKIPDKVKTSSIAAKVTPKPVNKKSKATMGYLSLRSVGTWLDVYLGTKRLGTTPIRRYRIPSGNVHLHLVNKEANINRYLDLRVPPNGEVSRTITIPK